MIIMQDLPNEDGCLEAARISRPVRTTNSPLWTTFHIIFPLVPAAGFLGFTAVVGGAVIAAGTVPRAAYPRVDVRVAAFEQGTGKRGASEKGRV